MPSVVWWLVQVDLDVVAMAKTAARAAAVMVGAGAKAVLVSRDWRRHGWVGTPRRVS